MWPSQIKLSEGSSSSCYISYEEWQFYRGKQWKQPHLNIVIQTTDFYCSRLNRCFLFCFFFQRKMICSGHVELKNINTQTSSLHTFAVSITPADCYFSNLSDCSNHFPTPLTQNLEILGITSHVCCEYCCTFVRVWLQKISL